MSGGMGIIKDQKSKKWIADYLDGNLCLYCDQDYERWEVVIDLKRESERMRFFKLWEKGWNAGVAGGRQTIVVLPGHDANDTMVVLPLREVKAIRYKPGDEDFDPDADWRDRPAKASTPRSRTGKGKAKRVEAKVVKVV